MAGAIPVRPSDELGDRRRGRHSRQTGRMLVATRGACRRTYALRLGCSHQVDANPGAQRVFSVPAARP